MSITIKQAINEFLLSCKVEGKSYGTIECYSDKLKGFLWYATNYDWPDDISGHLIMCYFTAIYSDILGFTRLGL